MSDWQNYGKYTLAILNWNNWRSSNDFHNLKRFTSNMVASCLTCLNMTRYPPVSQLETLQRRSSPTLNMSTRSIIYSLTSTNFSSQKHFHSNYSESIYKLLNFPTYSRLLWSEINYETFLIFWNMKKKKMLSTETIANSAKIACII